MSLKFTATLHVLFCTLVHFPAGPLFKLVQTQYLCPVFPLGDESGFFKCYMADCSLMLTLLSNML